MIKNGKGNGTIIPLKIDHVCGGGPGGGRGLFITRTDGICVHHYEII